MNSNKNHDAPLACQRSRLGLPSLKTCAYPEGPEVRTLDPAEGDGRVGALPAEDQVLGVVRMEHFCPIDRQNLVSELNGT